MTTSTPTSHTPLEFRLARKNDADSIVKLVNSAYRGDSSRAGWTTEADLLTGVRVQAEDVKELIETEGSMILLCLQNSEIVGSVNLLKTEDKAYLGMFAVNPLLQGAGIGKQFMQAAEALVKKEWHSTAMWMTVITSRHELIAYYERRGYQRTGRLAPFPAEVPDECRLVKDIVMEELEKPL